MQTGTQNRQSPSNQKEISRGNIMANSHHFPLASLIDRDTHSPSSSISATGSRVAGNVPGSTVTDYRPPLLKNTDLELESQGVGGGGSHSTMDLDGDTSDTGDLDIVWSASRMEPKTELRRSSVPPPRSLGFLLLLTAGIGGLQGIFALIFSNGSAYLTNLGLSKPLLALVWMAGPIAGMTLQPYFGICSDQCRSRWGRRRPFIAGGALAAIASLLGLAFAQDAPDPLAASLAVACIVVLNIAIQPLQGGLRSLVADVVGQQQQPAANAIAGVVVNGVNVASYALSFADLERAVGGPGSSQFAILCFVTSIALAVSVAVTCLAVRERVGASRDRSGDLSNEPDDTTSTSIGARLLYLCSSFKRLPVQVRQVCKVQFLSWMGWFPFLFYMTTYIGEEYERDAARLITRFHRPASDIEAMATRIGSLGMLLFALASLSACIALPMVYNNARDFHSEADRGNKTSTWLDVLICWPRNIRRIWIVSQVLFAGCMLSTAFVSSLGGTCILAGVSGISWAVTCWAPYVLLSKHMSYDITGALSMQTHMQDYDNRDPTKLDDRQEEDQQKGSEGSGMVRENMEFSDASDNHERRPGIVFGLHNASIAGPQIVAAGICSLIFWITDGTASQDGVGWALRAGGLAALVSAVLANGLRDE